LGSEFQTHSASAGLDSANSLRSQNRHCASCVSLRDNRHHANAHVEDLIHLLSIDVSIFLQDLEDTWDTPAFRFYYRVTIRRQDSRQIVQETTPGDVSEPFDYANGNLCQERLIVFVDAQQLFADRDC
jgi:hypothetical protein